MSSFLRATYAVQDTTRMSIMGHSMGGKLICISLLPVEQKGRDKLTVNSRTWRAVALPKESGPVQVGLCVRSSLQPLANTMGQEGVQPLHQPLDEVAPTRRMGCIRLVHPALEVPGGQRQLAHSGRYRLKRSVPPGRSIVRALPAPWPLRHVLKCIESLTRSKKLPSRMVEARTR